MSAWRVIVVNAPGQAVKKVGDMPAGFSKFCDTKVNENSHLECNTLFMSEGNNEEYNLEHEEIVNNNIECKLESLLHDTTFINTGDKCSGSSSSSRSAEERGESSLSLEQKCAHQHKLNVEWTAMREEFTLIRLLPIKAYLAQSYIFSCLEEMECINKKNRESAQGKDSELFCRIYSNVEYTSNRMFIHLGMCAEEVNSLRHLTWSGCKPEWYRAMVWRLLLGVISLNVNGQCMDARRKRMEYKRYVHRYYYESFKSCYFDVEKEKRNLGVWETFYRNFNSNNYSNLRITKNLNETSFEREEEETIQLPILLSTPQKAKYVNHYENLGSNSNNSNINCMTLTAHEKAIYNQISLDLPRHDNLIFTNETTCHSLRRCLFLWAQRHPAVGYVQGMDDIVGVFYLVFLCDALLQLVVMEEYNRTWRVHCERVTTYESEEKYFGILLHTLHRQKMNLTIINNMTCAEFESIINNLPEAVLLSVEADTYWCAGVVLSQLQDNFTPNLPGIKAGLKKLEMLAEQSSPRMLELLSEYGISLMHGCFQWLHCLFIRELSLPLLIRLWDTYFAFDKNNWWQFHLYVCASLLSALERYVYKTESNTQGLSKPLPSLTTDTMEMSTEELLSLLQEPMKMCSGHSTHSTEIQQANQDCNNYSNISYDNNNNITSNSIIDKISDKDTQESIWLKMLVADAYRLWRLYPSSEV